MSRNINIWSLPTAVQTLNEIRRELSEGVSLCIVATTPGSVYDFQKALLHGLEMEDCLITYSLHLPELESVTLAGIQKALVGSEYQSVSLDQFIRSEAPDVILVQGFDEVVPSFQKETISLIRRWADHCHAGGDKKSLCLVVPGNLADKVHEIRSHTTSSRLKIRYLAGIPSALEVQLISRAQSGGEFASVESHWRELLVSSLSGNDLDMAYLLGQSKLNDLDDINHVLKEYADLNSWKRSAFEKELKTWTPLANGIRPDIPQHIENIKLLWKQATVYTPEYGEEIHPAILALLESYDEIKHRVWRAQTTLVLPLIDELRIKIYTLLKNRLPNTWDHQDIPEIGQIKYSLEQLPMDDPARKQFYDTVRHARDIRNKLAHTEVIVLHEYIILWNSWQKIRQMICK